MESWPFNVAGLAAGARATAGVGMVHTIGHHVMLWTLLQIKPINDHLRSLGIFMNTIPAKQKKTILTFIAFISPTQIYRQESIVR